MAGLPMLRIKKWGLTIDASLDNFQPMELRHELLPPVRDDKRAKKLKRLVSKIVYGMDDPNYIPESDIAELKQLSGGIEFDTRTFFKAYDMADDGHFAEELALRNPPIIDDINADEVAEIVRVISSAENDGLTGYYISLLKANFPSSFSSDLIYWPHKTLTNEEVAEEVFLRQKLFEEGGDKAVVTRIRILAEAVLADPNSPPWAVYSAKSALKTG